MSKKELMAKLSFVKMFQTNGCFPGWRRTWWLRIHTRWRVHPQDTVFRYCHCLWAEAITLSKGRIALLCTSFYSSLKFLSHFFGESVPRILKFSWYLTFVLIDPKGKVQKQFYNEAGNPSYKYYYPSVEESKCWSAKCRKISSVTRLVYNASSVVLELTMVQARRYLCSPLLAGHPPPTSGFSPPPPDVSPPDLSPLFICVSPRWMSPRSDMSPRRYHSQFSLVTP